MRLAEEYDAAQERGEVRKANNEKTNSIAEAVSVSVSVSEIGITHKQVHEARQLRDAEKAEPGIAQRAVWGGQDLPQFEEVESGNFRPTGRRLEASHLWAIAHKLKFEGW
ncbi:hypothetical protein [Brucella sp.]|uniref:hypothetical protein n=1 Tax=Brucella sp. TaxID=52132 RepID=UPI00289CEF29|nr:hypothetical protein [Brucella sp.]